MPPSNDEQDKQLLALLAALEAETEQVKNPTATTSAIAEPSDEELAALEQELGLHDDLFDDDEFDPNNNDDDDDDDDDDLPGGGFEGLAKLLRAAAPAPVEEEPDGFLLSPTQEAEKLLLHLIDCKHLELEEGIKASSLAGGLAKLMESDRRAEAMSSAISAWLCDQSGVYDLYCDDTTLEVILAEW